MSEEQDNKVELADNEFELDGKVFAVVKPTGKQLREAKKLYNTVFATALRGKFFVRKNLPQVAKEYGIWDDEKDAKLKALRAERDKYAEIVDLGGIELKEAEQYAKKANQLHNEILEMLSVLNDLDSLTAEGQAEDEYKNWLMSQCIVYKNTKKPYCKDIDDFYEKADDPVVIAGVIKYIMLENKDNLETWKSLPEIKFLKDYGFMDDNYNYIDEDGNIVDEDGNPIKEEKREKKPFLKNGEPIDA